MTSNIVVQNDEIISVGELNKSAKYLLENNFNNLSVVGFTTLASAGGITTTGGDLYVGGDLFVDDDIVLDNIKAGSVFVSGLSTFIGLSTFNSGIEVVSGLSTFRGNVFVAAGATVGLGDSVFLPDEKKIIFGNEDDFSIAHDSIGYGGTKLINDSVLNRKAST